METDHARFKTVTVSDNGLRPTFDLACNFELGMQDMASLRFMVSDEDMFGDANIIAQNVYPLGSHDRLAIRTGAYVHALSCLQALGFLLMSTTPRMRAKSPASPVQVIAQCS